MCKFNDCGLLLLGRATDDGERKLPLEVPIAPEELRRDRATARARRRRLHHGRGLHHWRVVAAPELAEGPVPLLAGDEAVARLAHPSPDGPVQIRESQEFGPVLDPVRARPSHTRFRWIYALTLYADPSATLDDLREAVKTLEDIGRTARRVLGGAYPLAASIERELQRARAALDAREAPSPSA
jgi:hypothetical protein